MFILNPLILKNNARQGHPRVLRPNPREPVKGNRSLSKLPAHKNGYVNRNKLQLVFPNQNIEHGQTSILRYKNKILLHKSL